MEFRILYNLTKKITKLHFGRDSFSRARSGSILKKNSVKRNQLKMNPTLKSSVRIL